MRYTIPGAPFARHRITLKQTNKHEKKKKNCSKAHGLANDIVYIYIERENSEQTARASGRQPWGRGRGRGRRRRRRRRRWGASACRRASSARRRRNRRRRPRRRSEGGEETTGRETPVGRWAGAAAWRGRRRRVGRSRRRRRQGRGGTPWEWSGCGWASEKSDRSGETTG